MRKTNYDIYSHEEFNKWASKAQEDLLKIEKFVVDKYLIDKNQPVLDAGT